MFTTVTHQLKRALSAAKSVLAIADTAAAVLDPKLKAFLAEGEQLDGMKLVQLTTVRWIEDDNNRLEEHEASQRSALRELKKQRMRRDQQRATLYNKLLRIRKTFDDSFGQGTAAIYLGLGPRLGEIEPLAFQRQARETVQILSNSELETPEPLIDGIWESPERYAGQIQESLTPFEAALDEIETQKREVEKAQKAKTDLLEQLSDRLNWSIRLFEAIYQLAGLGFHAERLRLTVASRPSNEEPAGDSDGGGASETEGGEASQQAPAASP